MDSTKPKIFFNIETIPQKDWTKGIPKGELTMLMSGAPGTGKTRIVEEIMLARMRIESFVEKHHLSPAILQIFDENPSFFDEVDEHEITAEADILALLKSRSAKKSRRI